jgi:hypothetical protein
MDIISSKRTSSRSIDNAFQEVGSTIPLILAIFIIVLSTLMISANIYYIRSAKLELEAIGEDFLSNLYQEIDYQKYFFEGSEELPGKSRSWVSFECSEIAKLARQNIQYVGGKISLKKSSCNAGRVKLLFAWQVKLPFQPGFLDDYKPEVIATISGGVQRVREN